MKNQKILYRLGTLSLIIAFFIITFLPICLKLAGIINYDNFILVRIEFLLLFISAGLYCISHKYYKKQIFNIVLVLLLYILFVLLFPNFIK